MTELEFLQFILPEAGYYGKMVLGGDGKPRHAFYDTIDDLHAGINASKGSTTSNIYYAVSSFRTAGPRKQTNVQAVKCLFIDIDCGVGKPYPTWQEGLKALGEYLKRSGMMMPTIVHSGNGLHCYWVFTEEMNLTDWQPLANAFKQALLNDALDIDKSVSADSARVLRPIGTINVRGGNPVKLLRQGATTDPAWFQKKFLSTPQAKPQAPVTPNAPAAAGFQNLAIPAHIQGRTTLINTLSTAPDYPAANPDVVASKCAQIAWGIANQTKVAEPFWYAMLGVAAYCIDEDNTAVKWSDQHPTFDRAKTLAKMQQWLKVTTGPATCKKFSDERPHGCDKCKFKNKLTSPAQIGATYEEAQVAADAPDLVAFEVPLPWPFKRTVAGMKIAVDGTEIHVCDFDLYPLGYGLDETLGYEVVRFRWKRPHKGWTDIILRQALLNDSSVREFATALADQGIVLRKSSQIQPMQEMMRAYMDELRKLRSLTNIYANMGWKEQRTQFLIGTKLVHKTPDGNVIDTNVPMSSTIHHMSTEMYETKGTLAAQTTLSRVLGQQGLHVHAFAVGVSLSAPLYAFSGLDGAQVHLYGDTGAGKTIAQWWAQSMWGNPKALHFASSYTPNALYRRLGFHSNLPMTIDENTLNEAKHQADFLLVVTQGKEKARLTKDARERTPNTWATSVITSGNRTVSSILPERGEETQAMMMRLVEVPLVTHKIFSSTTNAGERISQHLLDNHGHIGMAFLKYVVALGEERVKEKLRAHKLVFQAKYGYIFSGQERFWQLVLLYADWAMQEARALGLIDFDHEACMHHILQEIGGLRKNVVEARVDNFERLSRYLNEHVAETLTVMHTGNDKGVVDSNRAIIKSIYIRQDIKRKSRQDPFDVGIMYIDKSHLQKWLADHGGDIKHLINELIADGMYSVPPSKKVVLGKGSQVKLMQTTVVGINLKHPRLAGILDEADGVVNSVPLTPLQLVTKTATP